MCDAFTAFVGMLAMLTLALLCYFAGYETGYDQAKSEAFKRGHAIQCLGKEGYYWECKDGNN